MNDTRQTTLVRDHNDIEHEVDIPSGWMQIHGGNCRVGDRYVDVNELTKHGGVFWRDIENEADARFIQPAVFGCLIRGVHEPATMVYSHRSNRKHAHSTGNGVKFRNHWFDVYRCPTCGKTASHKRQPITCKGGK